MKINDKTILEIEKTFERKGFNYDDFVSAFPNDDSLFGVIKCSLGSDFVL